MKKLLLIILAIAMVLPLAACKKGGGSNNAVTTEAITSELPPEGSAVPVVNKLPEKAKDQTPSDGVIIDKTVSDFSRTFKNPLITPTTPNAWPGYGVGDPFVMRWNGRYYLYPSTKDGARGIQVWSSDNLVEWKYEGLAATDTKVTGAYAPEVVYYNGNFYMYTSPAGNGHYVLQADNPLGPFEIITKNLGMSIDGDVFIDDDGKWYFYSAGGNGIVCYRMKSPSSFGTKSETGLVMRTYTGWTEGSMIIKYNDIYYMTCTGNHVWCDGYRINYGVSTRTPTQFKDVGNNPILLNTDRKELFGIGHSSTTIGPDLDSYYICYHSALGAPRRQLNVDRLVLNGYYLGVLGDTFTDQQAPEMPDVYNRFEAGGNMDGWTSENTKLFDDSLVVSEGGYALSDTPFLGNFTAEFNMKSVDGIAGAVFCYKDWKNYGTAYFKSDTGELLISFTVNGEKSGDTVEINKSFDEAINFNALQLLTVRRYGNEFTFFFNNRKVCSFESAIEGGYIGVASKEGTAYVGFVGINGTSCLESTKLYHKPVQGRLEAITCVETNLTTVSYDKYDFVTSSAGETYNYYTNVMKTGTYTLGIINRCSDSATIEIYQNGKSVKTVSLGKNSKTATDCFRGIELESGPSVITFKITAGSADIQAYNFEYTTEVKAINLDYSKANDSNTYSDGQWTISNGMLNLGTQNSSIGKRLYGDKTWTDYTVEADIKVASSVNCGILVRVQNASVGGSGNDVKAGTDFVQGYFIGLSTNKVSIGKMNYDYSSLISKSADIKANSTVNLKVTVIGNTFKVWVNGTLAIEYTDSDNPYMTGKVGLRGHECSFSVDNFSVNAE